MKLATITMPKTAWDFIIELIDQARDCGYESEETRVKADRIIQGDFVTVSLGPETDGPDPFEEE